jgi:hypothetical protein
LLPFKVKEVSLHHQFTLIDLVRQYPISSEEPDDYSTKNPQDHQNDSNLTPVSFQVAVNANPVIIMPVIKPIQSIGILFAIRADHLSIHKVLEFDFQSVHFILQTNDFIP